MPQRESQCTGYRRVASRRQFLREFGGGLGMIALAERCRADGLLPTKMLHHPPRAKRVLLLFMSAGVSHIDTFDHKPLLARFDGQPLTGESNISDVFFRQPGKLMKSPFQFAQYGESGKWVSELFPHMARHVDRLCFVHSMVAEQNSHGPAMYHISTGNARAGYPSLGSWVNYGLGSAAEDLPSFVVLMDRGLPPGGSANWGPGFLPAKFQGVPFRGEGSPILDLETPPGVSIETQAASLDLLAKINSEFAQANLGDTELAARIESYELAAKMQLSAPQVTDLSRETERTLHDYGVDRSDPQQAKFSRLCLLGRRLLERGVRFVTLFCGAHNNVPDFNWDAHSNLDKNHRMNALIADQPIGALLADLKQRGLLDDTLVIWTGEFGRTPTSEGGNGRDHNISGFTLWMAGGGVQEGLSFGSTDDVGFRAVDKPVTFPDFHATVLHALGIDHTRLTYYHNGLEQRLTGVKGNVVHDVFQ